MEPHRLGNRVAREIEDPESELWLSPISIWEVVNLARKKRVELFQEVDDWVAKALRIWPLKEAAVTNQVARELARLQLSHRDPADLFLLATAKVFGLTLVTADEVLLKNGEIDVLPA
jgi:PIN domain nuclease of toxin-antitoxin system